MQTEGVAASQTRKTQPRAPAPAVGRAFALLNLLAEGGPPLGVTQIAGTLGLGKATVHALVRSLLAVGALEDVGHKKYRLGPALEHLAQCRTRPQRLEGICHPLLRGLAERLKQTAILGVPERDRLRIAAVEEGDAELRISATVGREIPAGVGAHGKILSAWAEPNPENLRGELAETRKRGVAFDIGEYLEGVVAVAAPVLAPGERVLGVVYVVGLRNLMNEPERRRIAEEVREAASVASRRLVAASGQTAGSRATGGPPPP